jgi:hypothetical protein
VFLRQFYQQRRDALATKQHRHGNAQAATDLLFPRFKQRFCTPNLLQRAQAAFIKKGAVIGQPLAAGGALKQTYPSRCSRRAMLFPTAERDKCRRMAA